MLVIIMVKKVWSISPLPIKPGVTNALPWHPRCKRGRELSVTNASPWHPRCKRGLHLQMDIPSFDPLAATLIRLFKDENIGKIIVE